MAFLGKVNKSLLGSTPAGAEEWSRHEKSRPHLMARTAFGGWPVEKALQTAD
jgi:hypothetical protein